ncbi:hypothetical protein, partial [Chromobacterium alticapitis]|uniref:hypothetical protein n=1 Tax=Chromobacterium alticapitis TaxID=2073169 RepID=UPI001E2CD521
MSFHAVFKQADEISQPASVEATKPGIGIKAGIYNSGTLCILDIALAESIISNWKWLLGQGHSMLSHASLHSASNWSGDQPSCSRAALIL